MQEAKENREAGLLKVRFISVCCPVSTCLQQSIQNEMTGCNTLPARIIQEAIASIFQHVLAPSNSPPYTAALSIPHALPMPISPPLTTLLPTSVSLPQTPLPTRSITLAGGIHIAFTENDVPRPPSVSFARDIKKDLPVLNGMWDDTEHWAGFSFLNIHGHPIPIIYWKAVYSAKQGSGWKSGEWKLIKSNYFDWKVSASTSFFVQFHFSGICLYRFWSHAGVKEHLRVSGQSSAKVGNCWATRRYFVGWRQSDR